MNLQETLSIIETLKLCGVKRFKSRDFEIDFDSNSAPINVKVKEPLTPEQATATAEAAAKATEQLKNLINTVNLTPEELANKMFPDGAI